MRGQIKNNSINKDELAFADAFLKQHFDRIVDWAVGDIKRCCRMNADGTCEDNGALVGAFILWCCAVDYFGGLYTGNFSNRGTKQRISEFIKTYMKKYDCDKVYDLRWSLLHYYSPHHFVLYHENNLKDNKDKHLTTSNRGIMLHLGWAVKDLDEAVNHYKQDLEKDNTLKLKAWKYYKKQYPIMPIKVEEIYQTKTFGSLATGTSIQPISASETIAQDYWVKK